MFTPALTLALLPLAALASPQYGYGGGGGSGSTPTTSAASAAVSVPASSQGHISVTVGDSGLSFNPSNVTAQVGDIVSFYFTTSTPHSVTQSTFADPCTPLTGSNGTGFDSGLTTQSVFSINVTDASKPIWFFCKFPGHCGAGMVGSINAPSSGNDYPTFLSKAKSLGSSAPSVSDSGAVTGGVGAVATAGPSKASSAPSPSGTTSGAGRLVANGGLALAAVAAAVVLAA